MKCNFTKPLLLLALFAMVFVSLPVRASKKEKRCVVRLETTMGVIRIALSDLTPRHRDNFLRLANSGFYDGDRKSVV